MDNIENQDNLKPSGEEVTAAVVEEKPKKLVPSPLNIRRVMDKTGWTAYETYRHLREIHNKKQVTYNTIVRDNLWYDYKVEEAEAVFDKEKKPYSTKIKVKEFNSLFYTEEQRKAIRSMKKGKLTLKILFDYLKIELPQSIEGIDYNKSIVDKLAFRPAQLKPGSVYFCVINTNVCPAVFGKNKPAVVIGYPKYEKDFADSGIPFFPCKHLNSYILDISEIWRKRFDTKVVAITGSVGKTSTTEMITKVASASRKTYKVWGNINTTWQISRFIFNLKPEYEVFVQECSGSFVGQLEKTSRQLRPDIFVITNIGNCHIGKFDGKYEMLLHEKIAFDRHAKKDSIGIINWDDPLLKKANYKHKIISYSMNDPQADYHAENIVERDGKITCDIVEKDGTRTAVLINLCGIHNVYNALTAFIVGSLLGIEKDKIVESIAGYRTTGIRQNLTNLGGQKVYLDFYNAADKSIRTSLMTADTITIPPGSKRFAVLGDVLELGDESETIHRGIGNIVAEVNSVDEVFFFGNDSKFAFEEAKKAGVKCRYSSNRQEIIDWLQSELSDNDLLLLKGSHGMQMHKFVDAIYGTSYYFDDEDLITSFPKVKFGANYYRLIDDYGACLYAGKKNGDTLELPNEVDGFALRIIGKKAFAKSKYEQVVMPDSVLGIANGAFSNSKNLRQIAFSSNLKFIGANAFSNCKNLKKVVIPYGVTTIDKNAFSGCEELKKITIPSTVKTINSPFGDKASKIKIRCPKGSYAYQWAKENGYKVRKIRERVVK